MVYWTYIGLLLDLYWSWVLSSFGQRWIRVGFDVGGILKGI